MPRYIIDTDDGERYVEGSCEDAHDCPRRAQREAEQTLGAMAEDALPSGVNRVFRAVIRDDSGQSVYEASLTFRTEWKVAPPG